LPDNLAWEETLRTFTDNTSIQALNYCLDPTKIATKAHADTLLDVALNLLFSDAIYWSKFEMPEVVNDTIATLNMLKGRVDGTLPAVFRDFEPSKKEFVEACELAGKSVRRIFEGAANIPKPETDVIAPISEGTSTPSKVFARFVQDLLFDDSEVANVLAKGLAEKNHNSPSYVLCNDDLLLEMVRRHHRDTGWNTEKTDALDASIRLHLYCALPHLSIPNPSGETSPTLDATRDVVYWPNVFRKQYAVMPSLNFISRLEARLSGNAAARGLAPLRPATKDVTGIQLALIANGKATPDGVLIAAMQLRDDLKAFRKRLGDGLGPDDGLNDFFNDTERHLEDRNGDQMSRINKKVNASLQVQLGLMPSVSGTVDLELQSVASLTDLIEDLQRLLKFDSDSKKARVAFENLTRIHESDPVHTFSYEAYLGNCGVPATAR